MGAEVAPEGGVLVDIKIWDGDSHPEQQLWIRAVPELGLFVHGNHMKVSDVCTFLIIDPTMCCGIGCNRNTDHHLQEEISWIKAHQD